MTSRKTSKTVKTILDSTADPEAAIRQLRRQKVETKLHHTRTKFLPKIMKKVKVSLTQRVVKKIKTGEVEKLAELEKELASMKALNHVKLADWTFNTQIFKNEEYLQSKLKELEMALPQNDEDKIEIGGIDKILSVKCYQDAVKACRSDLVLFMKKLLNEAPVVKEIKELKVKEVAAKRVGSDKSFFMESLNADDSENNENDAKEVAFTDDEEEEDAYSGYLRDEESDTEKNLKKKKNRLGQVARRRLAEQKFGSEAKHIKSGGLTVQQREELRSQKSQQRKERLVRIKKDVAKASEFLKQKEASEMSAGPIKVDPKMHPSWAAKLQQQAKIQQATFQGQIIKFDE